LAALRNRSILTATVPAASSTPDIKSITDAGIMFHPGAATALHAVGLDIAKKYIEP
jgi:hypothetical protein